MGKSQKKHNNKSKSPEELLAEFEQELEANFGPTKIDKLLIQAEELINQRDFTGALEVLNVILNNEELKKILSSNDNYIYFKNYLSEEYFKLQYSNVEIHPIKENYPRAYFLMAHILVEFEDYKLALNYLMQSIVLSRVDPEPFFEAIYIHQKLKDIESVANLLLLVKDVIHEYSHFAKYYRIWGFYYIETKDYHRAYLCHTIALSYDKSSALSYDEIEFIIKESGIDFYSVYSTDKLVTDGINKFHLDLKINPNWLKASNIVQSELAKLKITD